MLVARLSFSLFCFAFSLWLTLRKLTQTFGRVYAPATLQVFSHAIWTRE
jgi:hypothetical protein